MGHATSKWNTTNQDLHEFSLWVVATLEKYGKVSGPYQVRNRPWSIVAAWDVDTGTKVVRYWGKTTTEEFSNETIILQLLNGNPNVPTLFAYDERKGYTIVPDHGTTIRSASLKDCLRVWETAIEEYSLIQRDSPKTIQGIRHINQETFDSYLYNDAISDVLERRLTLEENEQRSKVGSIARSMIEKLEEQNVPHTLCHDDLHSDNITIDGTILDWGDASITHPLASLFTVGYLAEEKGQQFCDRIVKRYLTATSEWTNQPVDSLREMIPGARIYASLGKMDTWLKLLSYPDHTIRYYAESELVSHYRSLVRTII